MRRIAARMFAVSMVAAMALSPIASNLAYAAEKQTQETTATINQKVMSKGESSLAPGHGIETNGSAQKVQAPTNNTGAPGSKRKPGKGKSSLAYGHGIAANGSAQKVQAPTSNTGAPGSKRKSGIPYKKGKLANPASINGK